MRVITPRQVAKREGATFDFVGREIRTMPGESLGAALLAAGERVCRTTPSGEPRGVFCGIGVCQDCLVTVDGVPTSSVSASGGGSDLSRPSKSVMGRHAIQ